MLVEWSTYIKGFQFFWVYVWARGHFLILIILIIIVVIFEVRILVSASLAGFWGAL